MTLSQIDKYVKRGRPVYLNVIYKQVDIPEQSKPMAIDATEIEVMGISQVAEKIK